jgi:hypothetical protein
MSERYPGGIISKTGVTPSGSFETSTAPGIWTLDQQAYWQKQGKWPTAGNPLLYIENLFSTYIYTGTGGSQTITNDIDLSTNGGLIWLKRRNGIQAHYLQDSSSSFANSLSTNSTGASAGSGIIASVSSTGFTASAISSGNTMASWTFRKQAKFFDVVTYTGNGANNRAISHNLGSTPGFIIVKSTSNSTDWIVYSGALGYTYWGVLNTTAAFTNNTTAWGAAPTSTTFTTGSGGFGDVNYSGRTYVAYLFAHDAGGFGLTGTDNVISCGSFTTISNGWASINLGYEPQWILYKNTTNAEDWFMTDVLRGQTSGLTTSAFSSPDTNTVWLKPNVSDAEVTTFPEYGAKTQTSGFTLFGGGGTTANSTYIYIAIRRGPMKVPTSGTSVFAPFYVSSTSGTAQTTNFPVDWQWGKPATGAFNYEANTRLLGVSTSPAYSSQPSLFPNTTAATGNGTGQSYNWTNTSFGMPDPFGGNQTALWAWRRAPSYFDVVAYTGTGGATTFTHNLGVAPEFMIVKRRSAVDNWAVYHSALTASNVVQLNTTLAATAYSGYWNNTAPTASVFTTGAVSDVNGSGSTYVAYLFATCAGVSKVGSFTGTAALQTVNCGFTTGARFILIKRTDSSGSWYIWDSARGISSGNDPYFLISTAAEVTGTNYVDTDTTGFKVTAAASTTVNISAATYIFLAIA